MEVNAKPAPSPKWNEVRLFAFLMKPFWQIQHNQSVYTAAAHPAANGLYPL